MAMKVRNMLSQSTGREVPNQFIITDKNKTVFQSYQSVIAIINHTKNGSKRLTLGRDWDYSRTTMRYLNQFLRDFYGWEDVCKSAIEKAIANKDISYDESLV